MVTRMMEQMSEGLELRCPLCPNTQKQATADAKLVRIDEQGLNVCQCLLAQYEITLLNTILQSGCYVVFVLSVFDVLHTWFVHLCI